MPHSRSFAFAGGDAVRGMARVMGPRDVHIKGDTKCPFQTSSRIQSLESSPCTARARGGEFIDVRSDSSTEGTLRESPCPGGVHLARARGDGRRSVAPNPMGRLHRQVSDSDSAP